jgi:CBS domain-containing protein
VKDIAPLIKRDFQTIQPYSGTQAIKNNLIRHSVLVVQDEDHKHLGILTPLDIIQRPHNLVIDCLSSKPSLSPESSIETALQIMKEKQADVLPVHKQGQFEGLVFKDDLIDFVAEQKKELEKKISERTTEIVNINKNLEISKQILNALFDNTQSLIFLVDPGSKIIFFIMDHLTDTENDAYESFRAEFEMAILGEYVLTEKEVRYAEEPISWYRTEYYPVYESGEIIGVAITVTNINDQKKHELQIQKQNEILRQIAWVQSHETRQPVATILGLINIIDKSKLTRENKEIIELLELTASKLDEVIRNTVIQANSAT